MPGYRLYMINAADRITALHSNIDCHNDADALAAAAGLLGQGIALEIWSGVRLVGTVIQPDD